MSFTALPPDRLTAQALTAQSAQSRPYWQQDIRYSIGASLDEPSGVLSGIARLAYRNNSPDTLRQIFLHLYLNAFRPGSLWSSDEQREGIERFARLADPFNAYERLGRVTIGEVPVTAFFPNTPDSTIAGFDLPRPLAPGESLVVVLQFAARPSVIPRRQGRRGRRFDFAQGYPKICVYDRGGWQAHPLRLAGELYGEYGSYDVTLDLAEDQVVAATGVPVSGDPGWAGAARNGSPVTLQRDWYRGMGFGRGTEQAAPGRKRVRFYAENIHHFAWSANPEYRYEEGRYQDVVLRTLYLPQDSATWGGGVVIARTQRAMAWLDSMFGDYPYPQTIVLHRIEGGGTEFPMLVMNGGPEESLIFHEVGHIYTYGILGNNEWQEAWLDEGLTTFQTAWNFQRRGMGVPSTQTQQLILNMDLDRWSQPVSLPAERFREFGIYNRMVYTKGQLFYEMLRYVVGEDAFRRGLRLYYDRWKLKHVDEAAFRDAMEQASGQELDWFFRQWLHEVPEIDYGIGGVRRWHLDNGTWRTFVTVRQRGRGVMPVDVGVPAGDTIYTARVSGRQATEMVQIDTPTRPGRAELDPYRQTMDWNYLNNREAIRLVPIGPTGVSPRPVRRLGWSSTAPTRRDRMVVNWMPLAWYSEAGGLTVGMQQRTNYLGRYEQNAVQLTYATREFLTNDGANLYVTLRNATWLRVPRVKWGVEAFNLDGRAGGALWFNKDRSPHLTIGPRVTTGTSVNYLTVFDAAYVDPRRWEPLYTVELSQVASGRWSGNGSVTELRIAGLGGLAGAPRRFGYRDSRTYIRGSLEAKHRRTVGRVELRGRVYAAGIPHFGRASAPRQRLIALAGGDPYETIANPFLRSRGALFVRPDVNYSAPGGAGLRGLADDVVAERAAALSIEAAVALFRAPRRRAFTSLSLAAFVDGGWFVTTDSATTLRMTGQFWRRRTGLTVGDAGLGLRAGHRIGPTNFVTRVDFPVLVSPQAAAVGANPADGRAKFRFVWSLEEAF